MVNISIANSSSCKDKAIESAKANAGAINGRFPKIAGVVFDATTCALVGLLELVNT